MGGMLLLGKSFLPFFGKRCVFYLKFHVFRTTRKENIWKHVPITHLSPLNFREKGKKPNVSETSLVKTRQTYLCIWEYEHLSFQKVEKKLTSGPPPGLHKTPVQVDCLLPDPVARHARDAQLAPEEGLPF